MSIEKFKINLKERFRDGFEGGTIVLKSQGLKNGAAIYNDFLSLESRFVNNENQLSSGLIYRNEYNIIRNQVLYSVYTTIDRIDIPDVDIDFLNDKYDSSDEKGSSQLGDNEDEESDNFDNTTNKSKLYDFDKLKLEKQSVLEKIVNEKILIPKGSIILDNNPVTQHDFIKHMMLCQEYYSLKEYSKALKECEYIKNNLEPKSAQLYELFFMSYFKVKGGEDSIILDIENGKFDTITNLELFAKRCKEFNIEFRSTNTADKNIEIICDKFSETLKERYSAIIYNYINLGDNIDYRKRIEKYINLGIDLAIEINISNKLITSFLETALTELNGGGKLDWFEISSDWKLINKADDFNSIKKREQIEAIIRKKGKLEFTKKRIYRNLGIKYSNIRFNNDKSNVLTVTESTIRFIKTSIITFKFYNDIRFLELAAEELKGKGRVNWYELNENNKIIPSKNCSKFNYNPFNDLTRIMNKFEGQEGQSSMQESIKEITLYLMRQRELENLKQRRLQIEKKYNEIEIVILEDGEIENDIENRVKIIECISEWMDVFKESRDQDETLHKCIDELSGNGKLSWFKAYFINEKEFEIINHPNCDKLNFDADKNLFDFCKKSSVYSLEDKILKVKNQRNKKIADKLISSANSIYNLI